MKDLFLRRLAAGVPKVLERFDPATGRFMHPGFVGPGLGWAVTSQDVMYPLALLYKTPHPDNPYAGDRGLLETVSKAGSAVRDWQYPDGQVEFIKIDGSKWGPTYMCWTQYHWLEAYRLLRDDLDPAVRQRWEEGLRLALDGTLAMLTREWRVHNIPAWHAMTLVRAGQVFDRADWLAAGRDMIYRVVAAQTPHGYWNEHGGPTTSYNLVYVHAIGLYQAFTGDDGVRDCLARCLEFHMKFTYPDGTLVETIDGRVKYHRNVSDRAWSAYSLFPEGRRFVRWLVQQAERAGQNAACSPATASAFEHFARGEEAPIPQDQEAYDLAMGEMARVVKVGKWFACFSAIITEPAENRWGMDRQSFVGLYHDDCGLIVGGGNSREQPAWSNFVVGDSYLPKEARLIPGGVELEYHPGCCSIGMTHNNGQALLTFRLGSVSGSEDAHCRLPLRVTPGQVLTTAASERFTASDQPIRVTGREAGGWIACDGWQVELPEGATFEYPVRPFNPYAKDGSAPLEEAVAIVHAPLSLSAPHQVFRIKAGG